MAALSGCAWWLARRLAPNAARAFQRELVAGILNVRQMPKWPLLASIPLTMINLTGRVAILPLLMLTLPSPPPIGVAIMGSFALLYSQLVLPTPSGAGVVELGFLGGAAGDLGASEAALLLVWRFYTTGVGVLLGLGLALYNYRHRVPPAASRASIGYRETLLDDTVTRPAARVPKSAGSVTSQGEHT